MFTNNYLVASFPLFHKVLVKTQVFTPANIVIQSFTLEPLYYKGSKVNDCITIFVSVNTSVFTKALWNKVKLATG